MEVYSVVYSRSSEGTSKERFIVNTNSLDSVPVSGSTTGRMKKIFNVETSLQSTPTGLFREDGFEADEIVLKKLSPFSQALEDPINFNEIYIYGY